ncbi:methyltransferase domain-containing protein [Clostridium sp. ZBS18]|uniref:methyltransferase domain-containing protein n=1 Tax=Clostridium sp. ZBS18 TaxID=2949967 RepID=UPI00207A5663|nr:methyltransferase domain-containing protein [Clostridium sp. ZBS18]
MSKYNFELDLDSENSLHMIIKMISPNSKILEFGPAHGRLTKYLKEELTCEIDIVEIDDEAGREANRYSDKSFIGNNLGDIEKYIWLEELKSETYDYIIFADVLEHLHSPKKVLECCNRILKDKGSILMSIPNIAHNSVLIDLVNDKFHYNTVGLLDNTHISFFSYNSLIEMIEESGYKTVKEYAVYSKVGENEINNNYKCVSRELAKELRKRDKGNLYQFIFEIKKRDFVIAESPIREKNLDMNSEYELVVYIEQENDEQFSESKTIRRYINPSNNNIEIDLTRLGNIKNIRLDPLTANCLIDIKSLYAIIDNKKIDVNILYTNGIEIYKNIYVFSNNDPQIYLDMSRLTYVKKLGFNCIFLDYDSEVLTKYESILKQIIDDRKKLIEDNKKLIEDNKKLIEDNKKLIEDNKKLIENNQKLTEEKQIHVEKQDNIIEEKNEFINKQNQLINKQQKIIEEKESYINNIHESFIGKLVAKMITRKNK